MSLNNKLISHLNKALKYFRKFIVGIVLFVLLYLCIALVAAAITVNKNAKQEGEVVIYIQTNGVHTDIVVPVRSAQIDWSQEVPYANTLSQDTTMRWLSFGWGDKGFYLETPEWKDLKASVAFKAMLGLGNSAMHATYYAAMEESEDCKKIRITPQQYGKLMRYIQQSFDHDDKGHSIWIKTEANYGDNDAFYEARGSYSLLHTCNTWANSALKSCGQKACLWTPFDKGIFWKYED